MSFYCFQMFGVEAVRRLFKVDAGADGTARRDQNTLGQRHRRLCGRERGASQHP